MAERFTIFRSVFDALTACPAEDAQRAFEMIGRYALDGVLPDAEKSTAYGLFLSVRPLIDTSIKRSQSGQKGGEANSKQTEANCKQTVSKPEANCSKPEAKIKEESINIKETLSKESAKKSVKRFSAPTVEQVKEYIDEKGYNIDPERFVDYYSSKGWVVGKSPMKDWKAAVRTWARSQRQEVTAKDTKRQEKTAAGRFANFEQRQYDFEKLEKQILKAQFGG